MHIVFFDKLCVCVAHLLVMYGNMKNVWNTLTNMVIVFSSPYLCLYYSCIYTHTRLSSSTLEYLCTNNQQRKKYKRSMGSFIISKLKMNLHIYWMYYIVYAWVAILKLMKFIPKTLFSRHKHDTPYINKHWFFILFIFCS